jgi:hypothetical protein
MSRDKKPKKSKYLDPKTGQFRHTDGDRRHRRGSSAKDAVKQKRKFQELGGVPPETGDESGEWDEAGEEDEEA